MLETAINVADEWQRLRGMLRFAILCGDVVEGGQDWQAWGPSGLSVREGGIDTDKRATYWQVLKALLQLRSNDPFGHDLLRRHVGFHCEGERCAPPGGGAIHWHQMSLTDLRSRGHTNESLHARRLTAMEFVTSQCRERID